MFKGSLNDYDITLDEKITDQNNILLSIQDVAQRNKAFEAELLGSPKPQINSWAGYAYNDSKITKDDASFDGLVHAGSCGYNQFNIWAHYPFAESALKYFSVGRVSSILAKLLL